MTGPEYLFITVLYLKIAVDLVTIGLAQYKDQSDTKAYLYASFVPWVCLLYVLCRRESSLLYKGKTMAMILFACVLVLEILVLQWIKYF